MWSSEHYGVEGRTIARGAIVPALWRDCGVTVALAFLGLRDRLYKAKCTMARTVARLWRGPLRRCTVVTVVGPIGPTTPQCMQGLFSERGDGRLSSVLGRSDHGRIAEAGR